MQRIKKKETFADQAFNLLKKEIISGELAPNEELPEEKLAKQLGISRTPIREAMKRLASEGLVLLHDARPATVATFTKDDVLHLMEIRRLLEVYNIESLSRTITPDVLHELNQNVKEQLKAITENDFHEFIDLDREFHLLLAKGNPNPKLKEMIHSVNTGVNRAFLVLSNTLSVSAKEAYIEHKGIVEALGNQNTEIAKQEMISHMENIEFRIHSYYKEEN
ncbi:GntR family transcriptional regulator [Sutcliffiella cohnii]|uniref:GntR family transcriptional regulator n=1 Tax=Sutcliffiella cohnii TaxID=33932 RepID=UPI002E20A98E|nr:GntR family transcriptional regulator [Sutcliffiella cohnii]